MNPAKNTVASLSKRYAACTQKEYVKKELMSQLAIKNASAQDWVTHIRERARLSQIPEVTLFITKGTHIETSAVGLAYLPPVSQCM
jgi:DNA-binding transcriptional regulator YbjK